MGSSSSSSSVYSCNIPENNNIKTPQTGKTYTLQCGSNSKTFSVLLYISSPSKYCPDGKTTNSAYNSSREEQTSYTLTFNSFMDNKCYDSAVDFLYYHALENGLMNPEVPFYSQSRFDTFSILSYTFISYIILSHNIRNMSSIDNNKISKIIEWFDKLNTTYMEPYKSRSGNGYYLYALKQLAYMYIKRAPSTSYNDIIIKLTNYFNNVNNVSLSNTDYSLTQLPEIQILSGTKTVAVIYTNGKPVLDSIGNPKTITATFNNDYFIKGEYRANRSIHYHDYHLRLLFSALIMLKAMKTDKSFFDTIKPTILSILTTLRKPNALDLYTVWSGGYNPDTFSSNSVNTTYNEYQFIFEDVKMISHTLMMYSVNSDALLNATNNTIGS
jgi:hypothetical protein